MLKSLYFSLLLLSSITSVAATLNCPQQLIIDKEKQNGWIVNNAKGIHTLTTPTYFDSAELLQGKPGDENSAYPAWLAPDKELKKEATIQQIWHINTKQNAYLLLCRYHNTPIYLSKIIPANIMLCSKTLTSASDKTLKTLTMHCK